MAPRFIAWFRFVRERADNTIKAYGEDLSTFLAFSSTAGAEYPDQVTVREIEVYLAWLRHERQLKASSVNRHLQALRAFWRWLVREGLADRNEPALAVLLKTPKRLPDYLTIPTQERVLIDLSKDATPHGRRDLALVAVKLFCGLRVQELSILKITNVDLEAGILRIIGKGNKERECVIIPRLGTILHDYLASRRALGDASSPYVFVRLGPHCKRKAGQPLLTRSIYQIVRRRLSPIVGRPIHPHALRHSFASRLRENGAPIELIQEAMGHEDIRTTMIYAHLSSTKRRADIAHFLGST